MSTLRLCFFIASLMLAIALILVAGCGSPQSMHWRIDYVDGTSVSLDGTVTNK
jgi:hypothetical protein